MLTQTDPLLAETGRSSLGGHAFLCPLSRVPRGQAQWREGCRGKTRHQYFRWHDLLITHLAIGQKEGDSLGRQGWGGHLGREARERQVTEEASPGSRWDTLGFLGVGIRVCTPEENKGRGRGQGKLGQAWLHCSRRGDGIRESCSWVSFTPAGPRQPCPSSFPLGLFLTPSPHTTLKSSPIAFVDAVLKV